MPTLICVNAECAAYNQGVFHHKVKFVLHENGTLIPSPELFCNVCGGLLINSSTTPIIDLKHLNVGSFKGLSVVDKKRIISKRAKLHYDKKDAKLRKEAVIKQMKEGLQH